MVSRYRDIIETNQPNLSRQTSVLSTASSVRNGRKKRRFFVVANNLLIQFVGSTSEPKGDVASVNSVTLNSSASAEVGIH